MAVALTPFAVWGKYQHTVIEAYPMIHRADDFFLYGGNFTVMPTFYKFTNDSLLYMTTSLDILAGANDRGKPDEEAYNITLLRAGMEFRQRIFSSAFFWNIEASAGGAFLLAQVPWHKDKKDIDYSRSELIWDAGNCAAASIGFMYAPYKHWGFTVRGGWQSPFFYRNSDYKTKFGGPFASIGVKTMIPGAGR